MIVFNPFIIHRGTCVGRKKNQRAHIHMRFTRSIKSNLATRNKLDNVFFKSEKFIILQIKIGKIHLI